MKQLIILLTISTLFLKISFGQNICPVCEDLIIETNIIDSPEINMGLVNMLQDTIGICSLGVDTNNINTNIAFIKKFFTTEDNLSACENDIPNCKFFMADAPNTIARYGIVDSVMRNINYPISNGGELYILQKDQTYCRIFQINVDPVEDDNISFNIYQDDYDEPVQTQILICPPTTLKVGFNNNENPEDFSYQWQKNDSLISNATTDTLFVNSIGVYKVVVTSNTTQCYSEESVIVVYKDNFRVFPFDISNIDIPQRDTITTCIGNEVILRASPGFAFTENNYTWSYEDNDYMWGLNDPKTSFTLNFTPTSATTINDTLRFTSSPTGCTYNLAVPVIQVFAPPTINLQNINIVQPESCVGSGSVTIELSDTSNIQYQLNLNGAAFVEFQDTNVFENVPINSNYSIETAIVMNDEIFCTATSEAFSIQSTGTAVSPNIIITNAKEIPGEPLIACVGAEIDFEITNTDIIKNPVWNPRTPLSIPTNSVGDTLSIKLTYDYLVEGEEGECEADTTILITIKPLPEPTVILTTDENLTVKENSNNNFVICDGENFTLSTEEDYDNYLWELNNETNTTNSFMPAESINENTEFTLTVTDSNGCESKPLTTPQSIEVKNNEDDVVKIREEHPAQIDTIHTLKFCKGSKAIYKYESNDEYKFEITPKGNNKITTHKNGNNKFIIVEWNTSDTLSLKASNNDNPNRCAGNEIMVTVTDEDEGEAPTGTIERFGNNSNTFILNHNNETIDNYQWFTIDEDGAYSELTEFANERIIDCSLTNCDTTTKILGLKITSGNCSNLIFKEDLLITNITELSANNIFNISPTVNNGEFYLTLNSINPPKQYLLSIYNISGQSVYTTTLKPTSSNFISVSTAPPGVYLAVIKEGQQAIAQQKLIIY